MMPSSSNEIVKIQSKKYLYTPSDTRARFYLAAQFEGNLNAREEKPLSAKLTMIGVYRIAIENTHLINGNAFDVEIRCASSNFSDKSPQPLLSKQIFETVLTTKNLNQIPANLEVLLSNRMLTQLSYKVKIYQEFVVLHSSDYNLTDENEKNLNQKAEQAGRYYVTISNTKSKPLTIDINCASFKESLVLQNRQFRSKPITILEDQINCEIKVNLKAKNFSTTGELPFRSEILYVSGSEEMARKIHEGPDEFRDQIDSAIKNRDVVRIESLVSAERTSQYHKKYAEKYIRLINQEKILKEDLISASKSKLINLLEDMLQKADDFEANVRTVDDKGVFIIEFIQEKDIAKRELNIARQLDRIENLLENSKLLFKNSPSKCYPILAASILFGLIHNSNNNYYLSNNNNNNTTMTTNNNNNENNNNAQCESLSLKLQPILESNSELLKMKQEIIEEYFPKLQKPEDKLQLAIEMEKFLKQSAVVIAGAVAAANSPVTEDGVQELEYNYYTLQDVKLVTEDSQNQSNENNNKNNEEQEVDKKDDKKKKKKKSDEDEEDEYPDEEDNGDGLKFVLRADTMSLSNTSSMVAVVSSQIRHRHSHPLIDKLHITILKLMHSCMDERKSDPNPPSKKLRVTKNNLLVHAVIRVLSSIFSDRIKKKRWSQERSAYDVFKLIPITKYLIDEYENLDVIKSLPEIVRQANSSLLFVTYLLEKGCIVPLLNQIIYAREKYLQQFYEPDSIMFSDDLFGVILLLKQFDFKLGLKIKTEKDLFASKGTGAKPSREEELVISLKSSVKELATHFATEISKFEDLKHVGDENYNPTIGNIVRGKLAKSVYFILLKGMLKPEEKHVWNILEAVASAEEKKSANNLPLDMDSVNTSQLFSTGIVTINESINLQVPKQLPEGMKEDARFFYINNAKLRAFVCYCLNYNILAGIFRIIIGHQDILEKYYDPDFSLVFLKPLMNVKSASDININRLKRHLHDKVCVFLTQLSRLPFQLSITFEANKKPSEEYLGMTNNNDENM